MILNTIKNIYIIVLTAFVIWMLFIDTNSWLTHHELNQQIELLEQQKENLKTAIRKDHIVIKKLSNIDELEKFARERYFMKKENEEIYIIEYADSLKLKENE